MVYGLHKLHYVADNWWDISLSKLSKNSSTNEQGGIIYASNQTITQ